MSRQPIDLQARIGLINSLMQQGMYLDAIPHFDLALRDLPDHEALLRGKALALNRLGTEASRTGDLQTAIRYFESALIVLPAMDEATYNLAVCCIQNHQFDRAQELLAQLGEASSSPELMYRAGQIALGRGAPGESVKWFRRAMDAGRDDAELLLDIGDQLFRLKAKKPAWSAYDAAERAGADVAQIGLGRAKLLLHEGQFERSETILKGLLEHSVVGTEARKCMIDVHVQTGNHEVARTFCTKDLTAACYFRAHLEVPPIADSVDSIEAVRQDLEARMCRLLEAPPRGISSLTDIAWNNFYLSYHGECNRDLHALLGDIVFREIKNYRPDLLEPPVSHKGKKRRIGFLSARWGDNVIGHYFGRWIKAFGEAGWETWCYLLPRHVDSMTDSLRSTADHSRVLSGPAEKIAEVIRNDRLDVIIIPEVGADVLITPLAAIRLAPVQLAAWGLPDTTGLPTIDGYLSVASMEPNGAKDHYREPLHLLPGLGTSYPCPPSHTDQSREYFGLEKSDHLYLFPHSHFKVHPEIDELLAQILSHDGRGRLVMFEAHEQHLWSKLSKRMRLAFEAYDLDFDSRVIRLPRMPRTEYLAVNRCCDVLLDTLHFSGGNTSLDALCTGLPVVTLPGAFLRGRQTMAILKMAGLDELIATDSNDYVEKALTVANNSQDHGRIVSALGSVIEDPRPLAALTEIVADLRAG